MAIPPVRLDPFQTIVGVSWASGQVAMLVFRHIADLGLSANSKQTYVQLLAPPRDNSVGFSSDGVTPGDRADPPTGSPLLNGVSVPTASQITEHYIYYGGWPPNELGSDIPTDETYLINIEKIVEDFSTPEAALTEIRIRLAVAAFSADAATVQLICRGYENLVFTVDHPAFGSTFHNEGPEIVTLAADDSVAGLPVVAIGTPPDPIGELVINLADQTAAFIV